MKPFKVALLPAEYDLDKELLMLLSEANQKYGEYKTLLNTVEFDSSFFLESIILNESFKSTQIEGTQISQDEIYYIKYMDKNDDNQEIKNLKGALTYAILEISKNKKIDQRLVNEMHKILLSNSVRGAEKEPGKIRTTQNWIGPKNSGIEYAIFVPPIPEEVPILLDNLFKYMNDEFIDPLLINIAISHSQFETIHPYRDGNGRLGRILIPIQLYALTGEKPILFLSEIIEIYKPSYQKSLNEVRKGNVLGFVKFILHCIIEQCNSYINKIDIIKKIYKEDMSIVEEINGSSIYKVMPVIMRQIVFTKKEVEEESGVSQKATSKTINALLNLKIIEKDDTVNKKGYKYKRIYDVFVDKSN